MKNIFKLLNVTLFMSVIVFSMTVCHHDDPVPIPVPEYVPPTQLTGTVTVTSAVTVAPNGIDETKKLTADVSGLNGNSSLYSYQWKRNGSNIRGASSSTYDVTPDDWNKTLRITVNAYGNYTGEQSGEIAVGRPTILELTLKRSYTTWEKETGIIIEKIDGTTWGTVSNTDVGDNIAKDPGSLTTVGAKIILNSWTETQFKMRTVYQFIETKYYFKKDNASGSEFFDLTNGTKTYYLQNKLEHFQSFDSPWPIDCFAIDY